MHLKTVGKQNTCQLTLSPTAVFISAILYQIYSTMDYAGKRAQVYL